VPLRVVSRLQYLTTPVDGMRPKDHDATHLVKAMKGRTLSSSQYSDVQIGGRWTRIRENNKDAALEWFGEWAAAYIDAQSLSGNIMQDCIAFAA
jgi:hypothetical protein